MRQASSEPESALSAARAKVQPQVLELLGQAPARTGLPWLTGEVDQEAAASYLRMARSAVGREPVPTAEDVALIRDFDLPGGRRVRAYVPILDESLPVLVYFHGGGWVLGNLEMNDELCRRLANAAGMLVLSVDYRLAPEHPFPAALDDAFEAVRWVMDPGCPLAVMPQRVAVAGTSAGGNLAAAVAIRCRHDGIPLSAQVLMYPVLDSGMATPSYALFGEGPVLDTAQMRWYWEQYVPSAADRRQPYASPSFETDLSGLAPAALVIPECDPLRDEGEAYGRRLGEADVPVTVLRYPGQVHSFLRFPGILSDADHAITEVSSFLRGVVEGRR